MDVLSSLYGSPKKSYTMTERDLEKAVMDGIFHPRCPYCGSRSVEAEPDAEDTTCQDCDMSFKIINPFGF